MPWIILGCDNEDREMRMVTSTEQDLRVTHDRAAPLAWLTLSRIPFMSVGILPFITGLIIARSQGFDLHWPLAAASLSAIAAILLSTHWLGEYFDLEGDRLNRDYNRFTGGSRILVSGRIRPRLVLVGSVFVLMGAGVLGLWVILHPATGPLLLPMGLLGIVAGAGYSVHPFRWAYRGAGEAMIGLAYGWLSINTGYYLMAGNISGTVTLVSLPLILSVMAVIVINEIPDYYADRAVGKLNLVVRLGVDGGARLYGYLVAGSAATLMLALPFLGAGPQLGLFLFPALGLAVWNVWSITRGVHREPRVLEAVAGRTILMNLAIAVGYGAGLLFL